MKTTMMAVKKTIALIGSTIVLAALGAACTLPSADSISAIPAGTIKISFSSTGSASARTAVPDLTAKIAVYVLSCTNTTTGTATTAEVSGTTSYEFTNVVPGSVTIAVSAYSSATTKDSTTLIATGSSSIDLASGEGANVTIPLKMESTGNPGELYLAIQWPASLADGIEWSIDGTAQTTPTITSSGGNKATTLSASPVAAGSHIIRITFKNGSATIGTLPESVNVYANLKTDKWIDASGNLANTRIYTANDFGTTGTDIRLLITSGTNSYTASLTSANASMSINVPTSATSIVFMPTAGTTGQTIQYAWGAEPYATIPSGQPVSLTFAGAATTLSLKVTDPAGSATVTYSATVNPAAAISSPTELSGMSGAGNYVLTADIDLSSYGTWTATGSQATPFTGSFDGGGHAISNLSVSTATGDGGLFGYISSPAVITNVRLNNVSISCTDGSASKDGVGAIVGENYGGTVTRCSVSGIIFGQGWRVGGIVGNNRSGGVVSECYSTATVTTTGWFAGGLVGWNWGTIENCYSRVAISGNESVGGLVEMNLSNSPTSTVINCYSAGSVSYLSSGTSIGGFMARNYGSDSQNYYDSTVSNCGVTGYGTAKTTAEMKTQSTYAGWNFDSIWTIDPLKNNGYPYLRSLPIPNDISIPSGTGAVAFQSLLSSNPDGNFVLAGPLDFGNTAIAPIATFTGTLDGGGNTILNALITVNTAGTYGFFASSSGTIKNLNLKNLTVQNATGTHTGGLVGYNSGVISRCSTTGSVAGPFLVGGLVGNNHGIIKECYSSCAVSATSDTVGGLVGQNANSIIDCYARGTVDGLTWCGGLIGRNGTSGSAINSYAAVTVTSGDAQYGGIQGYHYGGTDSNCFYDSSLTSGGNEGTIGSATSNTAMKAESTFTVSGWNFPSVWTRNDLINDGYPYLINNAP